MQTKIMILFRATQKPTKIENNKLNFIIKKLAYQIKN